VLKDGLVVADDLQDQAARAAAAESIR